MSKVKLNDKIKLDCFNENHKPDNLIKLRLKGNLNKNVQPNTNENVYCMWNTDMYGNVYIDCIF